MEQVKTFLADVSNLLDEKNYRKIYEKVPKFRQEKADRLKNQADRMQSVGAWFLWMQVQEMFGVTEIAEQSFNLSHSGRYVLCSVDVSEKKVGCDVECIKAYREALAKRFFCPLEYERILQEERNKTEMFYRYWVLKESFLKVTRKGMAMGLDTFEIRIPEEGDPVLIRQPEEIEGTYYFKEYQTDGARVAVCAANPYFEEKLQDMTEIFIK